MTIPDGSLEDFMAVQAQRRKEKLAAAKKDVANSLYDLADTHGRGSETAADAIENLIRVILEEK